MVLSKRLQAVATLVDTGFRVIDVGCDHAYLDIYLTLNNDNKCIATDINEKALEKAKENIKKYKLSRKIKTVLTNGLIGIDVEDTDVIVISGMGTYTILDILNTNKTSNTLVLSSNNNVDVLRREIFKLGYSIDSEIFLFDKGKPYIIIKFIKEEVRYNEDDVEFGPYLKHNKEYLAYRYRQEKIVFDKIPKYKLILRIKHRLILRKIKKLSKIKNNY